jgi:type IV pilus assembly protein PilV
MMREQRGTSLVEVLVTIVILAFGLLGLAGLQSRLQVSDMEAYQRAQALVLLEDYTSRISTNRDQAVNYVTVAGSPLGAGMVCPVAAVTRQQMDALQWCNALQGAAEVTGGANAGAMIGGRGCVEALPNNEYLVTIAWQGLTPTAAPPASVTCGANLYNDATAGAVCINDRCRRVVTSVVRIADFS